MKPGDIIIWKYNDVMTVDEQEKLWSTTMDAYVPIDSARTHIVVSFDGVKLSWLNDRGIFSASIRDNRCSPRWNDLNHDSNVYIYVVHSS